MRQGKRLRDGIHVVYDSSQNRPAKQQKQSHVDLQDDPIEAEIKGDVVQDAQVGDTSTEKTKTNPTQPKKQDMSTKLADFPTELLKDLQREILSLEAERTVGEKCGCCQNNSSPKMGADSMAMYRCLECFSHTPVCATCVVQTHQEQPFHHIQMWNGMFFSRASLHDLGHILYLGHGGTKCPRNTQKPTSFVVVHANGIHHRRILYCTCRPSTDKHEKVLQLVRHQLFPASVSIPQTAFTFDVLEKFHQHSLSGKISAYDYFDALRKHTDAAFPQHVPNRYAEFRLVIRLWRHLTLVRRAGQEHGIDQMLGHRRTGSLAVRCFACPEIGFNVEDWVFDLTKHAEKRHIYTLFISADGNFRLQRKRKNDDPDDKGLNRGNAYFVDDARFEEYLQDLSTKDVTSLCSKLKAVRQQDRTKFKDAVVSGVVAVQCARHGIYLPQAMVDLTKGESYVKTDYALFSGLGKEGLCQEYITLSYDIWCQYHKKLEDRARRKFPDFEPLFKRHGLRGAVPKMHINGHNAHCQIEHSFVYEPHSGMTCGEGIESAWSEQNHAASFTKEQNPGHRHDTLDDFNGYWNWSKLRQLPSHLYRQRHKWGNILVKRLESFKSFSQTIEPDLLKAWDSQKLPACSKSELYQVASCIPSRQKAYTTMLELGTSSEATGIPEFIQRGIEIEVSQYTILHGLSDDVDEERSVLLDWLRSWRSAQSELFPLLQPLPPINEDCPEKTSLALPSSYTHVEHEKYLLQTSVQVESELRLGHAYDILAHLRDTTHELNYVTTDKRFNGSSQRVGTRIQTEVGEIKARQKVLMDQYTDSFTKLGQLGALGPGTELRPLDGEHLWGKNVFEPHTIGDSTRQNPWFWFVGKPNSITPDNWLVELDRVRWFRERAAVERLQEEVEILEEEFRRVHKSFSRMSEVWSELAERNSSSSGHACYARRQADMYLKFATECWKYWKNIN